MGKIISNQTLCVKLLKNITSSKVSASSEENFQIQQIITFVREFCIIRFDGNIPQSYITLIDKLIALITWDDSLEITGPNPKLKVKFIGSNIIAFITHALSEKNDKLKSALPTNWKSMFQIQDVKPLVPYSNSSDDASN